MTLEAPTYAMNRLAAWLEHDRDFGAQRDQLEISYERAELTRTDLQAVLAYCQTLTELIEKPFTLREPEPAVEDARERTRTALRIARLIARDFLYAYDEADNFQALQRERGLDHHYPENWIREHAEEAESVTDSADRIIMARLDALHLADDYLRIKKDAQQEAFADGSETR